ncbi:MAG: aquaporin [Planctomycetota bacterium]|nr:MAG: aquaporin [Planctomycetota bacterium]
METKPALAELVGTFLLVLIGAGAATQMESGGLVGVALAHGLALVTIVYAWGGISGAHVNPAVTFGVVISGRMEWPKAVTYWVAQFLGALAAAYLLQWLVGIDSSLGATVGRLTPLSSESMLRMPDAAPDAVKVIVLEAILTFFLVTAVFASGVAGRSGNLAGLAIGLVLAAGILAGGPLTGGSMNPARTLGPAAATGELGYVWMYFVGPLVGGTAAAFLYDKFFLPAAELTPPVEAAARHGNPRR